MLASNEMYSGHTLVDHSTPVIITLHYTEKDGTGTWYMQAPVTINVKCDSGTTEPEKPAAPDVVKLLGTNAVEVLCVTNNGIHGSKTFRLLTVHGKIPRPEWRNQTRHLKHLRLPV